MYSKDTQLLLVLFFRDRLGRLQPEGRGIFNHAIG